MKAGHVTTFPWTWVPFALLLWLGAAVPSPADAAPEIAILKSSDLAAYNLAVEGFRTESGTDGITFREYDLQGDLERGRKQARRLRASDASIVMAVGIKAALAAKLEILDIPVIYCLVLDPDKYDLSAPNLSGISLDVPLQQQLSTMRTVLPKLKRIGVLFDPAKSERYVRAASAVAKQQGLELVAHSVSSERELPPVIRMVLPTVDALWLIPDTTVLSDESLPFILQESLEANRPVFGFSPEFVKRGALLSLSVNYKEIGKQAARLSKQLLDRQVAAPVRAVPEHFTLAVNLKTARFLGIDIPPDIERRAEERY